MKISVSCTSCPMFRRYDVNEAKFSLARRGAFGFGRHVSDPRAFVARLAGLQGWSGLQVAEAERGRVKMRCPAHRDVLRDQEDRDV